MYKEAKKFATLAHNKQTRKITKEPYIVHPIAVSETVVDWFSNKLNSDEIDILKTAGVLHDTIEDTPVKYEDLLDKFGIFVANLVNELTIDKSLDKNQRHKKNLNTLMNGSDFAKMLKLADIWDNMKTVNEEPRWNKYRKESLEILNNMKLKDERFKQKFEDLKIVLVKKIEKINTKN